MFIMLKAGRLTRSHWKQILIFIPFLLGISWALVSLEQLGTAPQFLIYFSPRAYAFHLISLLDKTPCSLICLSLPFPFCWPGDYAGFECRRARYAFYDKLGSVEILRWRKYSSLDQSQASRVPPLFSARSTL